MFSTCCQSLFKQISFWNKVLVKRNRGQTNNNPNIIRLKTKHYLLHSFKNSYYLQTVVLVITFITTRWQPNIPNIVSHSKLILLWWFCIHCFARLHLERLLVLKGKQNRVYEESSAYNRQGQECKVECNFGTICLLSKCCIYRLWCLGGIHFKRMSYIYICLVVFFVLFCQCREFEVELGDISNISDNIAIIIKISWISNIWNSSILSQKKSPNVRYSHGRNVRQLSLSSCQISRVQIPESELPCYNDTFFARCFVYLKQSGNHAHVQIFFICFTRECIRLWF